MAGSLHTVHHASTGFEHAERWTKERGFYCCIAVSGASQGFREDADASRRGR